MNAGMLVKISLFLCCFSVRGYAQEIIQLLATEWPPFTSEKMDNRGIYAEIVSQAYEEMGVQVQYHFLPAKRVIRSVDGGQYVGAIAFFWNDEREKKFHFSEPIAQNDVVFFQLKTYAFDWKTTDDLQGIPIGGTLGYNTLRELKKLEAPDKEFYIHTLPSDMKNLELLILGRTKLFACGKEVGLELLREHFPAEVAASVTYHPKAFYSKSLHAVFSRKHDKSLALLESLNEGLKILRKTGRYQAILGGE